ncbi:MAG: response regulator, partial [Bacteroidota bacterium]
KVVLVVEDEDYWFNGYIKALKDSSLTFDRAITPPEAIEKVRNNPNLYDLILVDLIFPTNEGFNKRVLPLIRDLRDIAINTPIIAMTKEDKITSVKQALEYGAQDYLIKKNFDPEIWGKRIMNYIQMKRANIKL